MYFIYIFIICFSHPFQELPHSILCFLLNNPLVFYNPLSLITVVCRHGCRAYTIPLKRADAFSPLSAINNYSGGVVTWGPFPFCTGILTGLILCTFCAGGFRSASPCHGQEMLSHPDLWLLQLSCLLFCDVPWATGGMAGSGVVVPEVLSTTEPSQSHSSITVGLNSYGSLHWPLSPRSKVSLTKVESLTNIWV